VGAGSWEEGVLGADVLASGNSRIVDFDDGTGYCRFDLRAVFDDGAVLEREDVNICEIGTYNYTD
jgi:hypothetical protein